VNWRLLRRSLEQQETKSGWMERQMENKISSLYQC
jgi:hypothetical protein